MGNNDREKEELVLNNRKSFALCLCRVEGNIQLPLWDGGRSGLGVWIGTLVVLLGALYRAGRSDSLQ